jgi:transketolase
LVPDGVYERFADGIGRRCRALRDEWKKTFLAYEKEYPQAANEIATMLAGELPAGWDAGLPTFATDEKGIATRDASGKMLNPIAQSIPWLIGGSGDLSPSTKTTLEGDKSLEADDPGGRIMHFGVREHAMGAIVSGLVLSKLRAFGATFLTFSDYMRPSLRLAALMELPVFHVFTHDSIGLGEDGPTHQPIEQLVGLRAIPNMIVLRPADANEVREAYKVILGLKTHPACLVLSRQKLPVFDRNRYAPASGLARGAYVLADADTGKPEVILIASGSEVQLCVSVYETLKRDGIAARVVSMPSWELFERQDPSYRDVVLPPHITARVAVEMGAVIGWDRYAGPTGAIIGMHSFGASGKIGDVLAKFGFVPDKIMQAAKNQIAENQIAKN